MTSGINFKKLNYNLKVIKNKKLIMAL